MRIRGAVWFVLLLVISAYAISFGVHANTDDVYEDNDSPASAVALSAGSYELYCADEDWFIIHLGCFDTLDVTIEFNSSLANLDLYLYDDELSLMDHSTGNYSGIESVLYTARDGGDYYICVRPMAGSAGYNMDISISHNEITSFNETSVQESWERGNGWGYRWDLDFGKLASMFAGSSLYMPGTAIKAEGRGGIVYVLYIEYEGEDSKGYRFMYEGRMYCENSDLVTNISYDCEEGGIYCSGTAYFSIYITLMDVNYSGHFWLKGFEYEGDKFYGIVEQSAERMEYKIDISTAGRYNFDNESFNAAINMSCNILVQNLSIIYTPAVPCLPLNEEAYSISIDNAAATYSGSIYGNYSYNLSGDLWDEDMDYEGMPHNTSGSGTVDEELSTTRTYWNVFFHYNPSTHIATAPMPVQNIISAVDPLSLAILGDAEECVGYGMLECGEGKVSNGFYTKIMLTGMTPLYDGDSPTYTPFAMAAIPTMMWSKEASKEDVERVIMARRPSLALEEEEQEWVWYDFLLNPYVIGAIAAICVSGAILGCTIKRKRKVQDIKAMQEASEKTMEGDVQSVEVKMGEKERDV